jgi:hypothetical protein
MSSEDPTTTPRDTVQTGEPLAERTGPRVVYDKVTGYPVVTARPGTPIVTNEEVRKMLEDFP